LEISEWVSVENGFNGIVLLWWSIFVHRPRKLQILKQCLLMLLLAVGLAYSAAAQEQVVAEETAVSELVRVSSTATPVSSTNELPKAVQASASALLKEYLGTLAEGIKFSNGEVVHFNSVLGEKKPFDTSWVVPMYELRFRMSDTNLGVQAYDVELRLDKNGQLLYINWPKTGYTDHRALASWQSVLEYATTFAKRRKFYSRNFQVYLRYNPHSGKMNWVFLYPTKDLSNTMVLRAVEIDWQGPALVKEYMERL
jgi:hypothetical protein